MPTQSHDNNNNNNEGESYTSDNRVVEPKEVDVLCGRGGMSNHHPGNEWYRRLIRSNRPLYRACPKHTKLLVSKAIVQAVEQQGGRFLEKAHKGGFWYPVPYKRAVDKTSQGLRERDREDGGGNGDDDDDGAENNTVVPASFRGNSGVTPNLGDLADVAIAHANASRGAEGLQPQPQSMKRPSLGGGNKNKSAMKKQPTGPPRRNSKTGSSKNNNKKSPARSSASSAAIKTGGTNPNNNNNRSSWPQIPPPPVPGASSMGPPRQPANASAAAAAAAAADDDLAPLPPTLEQRQSSIFRLFQSAKLLPNTSTALNSELWSQNSTTPLAAAVTKNDSSDSSVPPNIMGGGSMQLSPQPMQNQQQSYSSPARLGNGAMNNMLPSNPYSHNIMGGPGMYATNPAAAAALYEYASQQYPRGGAPPPTYLAAGLSALVSGSPPFSNNNNPSLSPPNIGGNINNGNNNSINGADTAPALTRLTSQVSDWLYSFWPVASTRTDSVAGPMLGGGGGSPMRNKMGQEQIGQVQGQQQQQQKRPDPLGADGDSEEEGKTDSQHSNKRKSTGPYSDMVNGGGNQSLTAKQEKELERDARRRFSLAPPIVTVPPPKPPGPVHINTIPPLQTGDSRELSSHQSHNLMNDHQQQHYQMQQQHQLYQHQQERRYSQEPPRKRNKRKSSANMPELPYDHRQLLLSGAHGGVMPAGASSTIAAVGGGSQGGMNPGQGVVNANNNNNNIDDSNMDSVAPPTELEQSVSATLLKLAGSPSKHLLSGLTRFFETGETTIGTPLAPGTTEAYFLRAMAGLNNGAQQSSMMTTAPSQMMSSISGGGGGNYYGAPPVMADDFRGRRGGPDSGPSLYGNKRSEGDLLDD